MPDLDRAIGFYRQAFGLRVTRLFGREGAELAGLPVRLYLLARADGSLATPHARRTYARHWTPVHLDIVVEDVDAALARAVAAGARVETPPRTEAWGRIATLADPFGHGLCLIAFLGRGYDEIAPPIAAGPGIA